MAFSPDGSRLGAILLGSSGFWSILSAPPETWAVSDAMRTGFPTAVTLPQMAVILNGGLDRIPIGRRHLHDFPGRQDPRILTARILLAFAFSKDGAQLYGVVRNTE